MQSAARLQSRETQSVRGLSSHEAGERLRAVGLNEFRGTEWRTEFGELWRVIANPLILILLAAAAASAYLGQAVSALIIFSMVLLSSLLNSFQTLRSQRAAHRLRERIAPTAEVLRDGHWTEVLRREVVPGDVIRVSAGDLVPADARLIEADDLHVHEAALTGESLPVEKLARGPDHERSIFLGTSIVSGMATAEVTATGRQTAFGEIVSRLSERPEETEFERGMRKFALLILNTVVFLVLFILLVNLSLGRPALEALLFSVALAVGLTPEFLPMITTVTLAEGAVRMAREKVIVKHLSAIQNLGSIDILCSDKTGTLTEGQMSLFSSIDPYGTPKPRVLELGGLNSAFETGIRSPFDAAILKVAQTPTSRYRKTDEIPFDFERKRLSIVVSQDNSFLMITKGAPENVLAACSFLEVSGEREPLVQVMHTEAKRRLVGTYERMSEQGLRVLAVAYREVRQPDGFHPSDERDLILVGFLTFRDPLLHGVKDSLALLRRDGVQMKILTGDNELVTRQICSESGIAVGRIVLGSELDRLDEPALARLAERTDVFARVLPAQKHRIIRALKSRGHVVGFLGDGINDAPSLHGADVGISVAGAVDLAREASDIILLERRLSVLHGGILAGRRSFGNVLKYLLMGTSSNFGNMISMAFASVVLPFLPMLPMQILLNNFLYDLAQVTIPTDHVDPLFIRRPQRWDIALVRNFMITVGPISSVFDFITYYALLRIFGFGEVLFHTGWFVESLATQTLILFVIRTAGRPWTDRPSLPLAVTTVLIVIVGALLPYMPLASTLGFAPLGYRYLIFVVILVVSYLALVELVKASLMRKLVRHPVGT